MIYITNAKARINILSITACCGNIGYLLLTITAEITTLPRPLVGWEWVKFGQLILTKIIKNVATKCPI